MDIPWNPAVLEQRIGRVHRMGQNRTVRVVNFVSRASIEERILDLLRFKKSLFAGALDEDGADVVMVGEAGMGKFMQSVEEAVAPLATLDPDLERQERIEAAADEQAAKMRELAEDRSAAVTEGEVKGEAGAAAGAGSAIPTGEGHKVGTDAGIGAASGNTAGPGTEVAADALNHLLIGGAQFLMNLSKAIARPPGMPDDNALASGPSAADGNAAPSVQKTLQGMLGRDEATGKTYLKIPMPEAEAMNRIVSGLSQLLSGFMNR
jgi:hypothetical protein